MVRDFAQAEIKPIAAKIDQDEKIPPELFKKMGEIGLLGIAIDEKYGGSGGDYLSQAIACEEISRASGSVGTFFLAHLSLATNPIVKFGNEEQKKKYLRTFTLGIINLYNQRNPNAFYFTEIENFGPNNTRYKRITLMQRSFFPFMPNVGWSIRF